MSPPIPGRRRRLCRIFLRRLCTALLLLAFIIIAAGVYLNEVGLPGFLKRPLLAKLHARGIDLQFSQLRWHWYRGFVAEDVHFGRAQEEAAGPQLSLKEVELKLNHGVLAKFRLNIDSLILHDGRLVWPVGTTNGPPLTLSLTNIQTQLRFLPNDQWELAYERHVLQTGLATPSQVKDARTLEVQGGTLPLLDALVTLGVITATHKKSVETKIGVPPLTRFAVASEVGVK